MSRTLLALLLLPALAHADVAPATSYTIPSQDGKSLLVLILPKGYGFEDPKSTTLRAKYPNGGVYRRGDPSQPVCRIDWYTHAHGLFQANDGEHTVRVETQAPNCYHVPRGEDETPVPNQPALTLYRNGMAFRAFTASELFTMRGVVGDALHDFNWTPPEALDESAGTVTITATTGEVVTVDFRTGAIVKRSGSPGALTALLGAPDEENGFVRVLMVAVVGVVVVLGGLGTMAVLLLLFLRRRRPALRSSVE